MELLTARQAAELLRCSQQAILRACHQGLLDAIRTPYAWLIRRESLAQLAQRLAKLEVVRRSRSERMRRLWQQGRLRRARPKSTKQVVIIERRPKFIVVGQGVYERTMPVVGNQTHCPSCGSLLVLKD